MEIIRKWLNSTRQWVIHRIEIFSKKRWLNLIKKDALIAKKEAVNITESKKIPKENQNPFLQIDFKEIFQPKKS